MDILQYEWLKERDDPHAFNKTYVLVGLCMVMLLSACAYPTHKTLQPEAVALVLDSNGKPIVAADVYLIANAYPYAREKQRNKRVTNMHGQANFPLLQEWRVEVLMLHGSEEYFWNWCVKKEGYQTQSTHFYDGASFATSKSFTLVAGESAQCPVDFR